VEDRRDLIVKTLLVPGWPILGPSSDCEGWHPSYVAPMQQCGTWHPSGKNATGAETSQVLATSASLR